MAVFVVAESTAGVSRMVIVDIGIIIAIVAVVRRVMISVTSIHITTVIGAVAIIILISIVVILIIAIVIMVSAIVIVIVIVFVIIIVVIMIHIRIASTLAFLSFVITGVALLGMCIHEPSCLHGWRVTDEIKAVAKALVAIVGTGATAPKLAMVVLMIITMPHTSILTTLLFPRVSVISFLVWMLTLVLTLTFVLVSISIVHLLSLVDGLQWYWIHLVMRPSLLLFLALLGLGRIRLRSIVVAGFYIFRCTPSRHRRRRRRRRRRDSESTAYA